MVAYLRAFWLRVKNEPAVVLAVAIAAVNTATDQTWAGYAAAVATGLLRFLVFGPESVEKE